MVVVQTWYCSRCRCRCRCRCICDGGSGGDCFLLEVLVCDVSWYCVGRMNVASVAQPVSAFGC